jgi:hypothetical protein
VRIYRGWKPLPQKFDAPWERLPAAIKIKKILNFLISIREMRKNKIIRLILLAAP